MMMLGTFAFSITMSADAKRLHDPEVETEIVERNSMSAES